MEFCTFASGSSGNCYMVRTDDTVLLVDAGIAGKRIAEGLAACGTSWKEVSGIFLTHEHTDHVRSVRMAGSRAANAVVYGTRGTLDAVRGRLPEGRAEAIHQNDQIQVGDIRVTSFAVSHDAAEPCAYTFESGGQKVAIMTDTGAVGRGMFEQIRDADAMVLESNHEVEMLKCGPYPYMLKRRILGKQGHLSNDTAGKLLCRILQEDRGVRKPAVVLGHLSGQNNTPGQALLTVKNTLFEQNYFSGEDLELSVASRSERGPLIRVASASGR